MKPLISSVTVLLLAAATATAQGVSTGGSSLLLPFTADGAALAGSDVAASRSLSAIPTNPATLDSTPSNDVRFTHIQWFEDVQSQSLVAAVPIRSASLAFAITNTSVPGIEVRDIPGPPIGVFTARAVSMRASAALTVSPGVSVGITAKYLYEKIYIDDATGLAADAGVIYQSEEFPWRFGASVTNIGSLGAFRSQTTDLPTSIHCGASRSFDDAGWAWTLYAAVSRETRIEQNHLHFGAEANYDGTFFVRGGYVSGYESRNWSAGLGVKYGFVRLDYAMLPFELGLRTAHCISIGIAF